MDSDGFRYSLLRPKYWPAWLCMGLCRLVAGLPYPLLMRLGDGLGDVLYRFGGERRCIVERNVELCFPELSDAQRRELVRRNFDSYGRGVFEVAIAWWWPPRRLMEKVEVRGLEHLDSLRGQGALLMAIHSTTLEVGAQAVSLLRSINGMYRPHRNPVFDYLQRRGRLSRNPGAALYPRKDLRGVVRVLRRGGILWYAPDQDYGRRQSVFVPFFGMPAATVTATARIAAAGRAAVLPFTQIRLPGGGYQVQVHPPLQGFPTGDNRGDAARINSLIEGFIREQPDQYLWAHRRFKTRPTGVPPLYERRPRRRKK